MAALLNYMRSLNEVVDHMTIAAHDTEISIAYVDGRVQTLQADNKTVEEKAETGLFKVKRNTRWNGNVLIVEFDIDGGPKIERRYEVTPDGTELHITQTMTGGMGGRGGGSTPEPLVYVHPRQ
jgi:hypothetical protein